MKNIITPVGLSLFTNFFDNDYDQTLHDIYEEYNDSESYPAASYDKFQDDFSGLYAAVTTFAKENPDASAEMTSIREIVKEVRNAYPDETFTGFLLASDSLISRMAAEIIQKVLCNEQHKQNGLKQSFFEPKDDVIPGLQVVNKETFQDTGLLNLLQRIEDVAEGEGYHQIILNITGGFKATIPYLTIIGQVHDADQYYIFEDTKQLLPIPQMPVQFDWQLAEQYYPYLQRQVQYSKHEKALKKELQQLHLVSSNGTPTILGKMYSRFIKKEMPISKNVVGYFIEYKLFEHYVQTPYQGKYKYVKRGVEWPVLGKTEFDVILKKEPQEQSDFIVGEVKPFWPFWAGQDKPFEEITDQVEKHVTACLKEQKIPKEYHLYIYLYPNQQRYKKTIKTRLLKIGQILAALNGCRFRTFFVSVELCRYDIRLGRNYQNIYQKFMSQPISQPEEFTDF